jgi:hypothetical protein
MATSHHTYFRHTHAHTNTYSLDVRISRAKSRPDLNITHSTQILPNFIVHQVQLCPRHKRTRFLGHGHSCQTELIIPLNRNSSIGKKTGRTIWVILLESFLSLSSPEQSIFCFPNRGRGYSNRSLKPSSCLHLVTMSRSLSPSPPL